MADGDKRQFAGGGNNRGDCHAFSSLICIFLIFIVSLHEQGKHAGVSLFLITNPPTVPQAPKGGFAILI